MHPRRIAVDAMGVALEVLLALPEHVEGPPELGRERGRAAPADGATCALLRQAAAWPGGRARGRRTSGRRTSE
jgi:hypothetical protein